MGIYRYYRKNETMYAQHYAVIKRMVNAGDSLTEIISVIGCGTRGSLAQFLHRYNLRFLRNGKTVADKHRREIYTLARAGYSSRDIKRMHPDITLHTATSNDTSTPAAYFRLAKESHEPHHPLLYRCNDAHPLHAHGCRGHHVQGQDTLPDVLCLCVEHLSVLRRVWHPVSC